MYIDKRNTYHYDKQAVSKKTINRTHLSALTIQPTTTDQTRKIKKLNKTLILEKNKHKKGKRAQSDPFTFFSKNQEGN